jgi:hypothetical protein
MRHLRRIPSGAVRLLAILVGVVAVVYVCGATVFSPGGLSEHSRTGSKLGGVAAHAELTDNCSACHAPPWHSETMATRCLACHTQVRDQLDHHQPLHGKLADGARCRDCHTEHRGPQAQLTRLDRFHHDFAAFPLTGKHQAVECRACHRDETHRGTPTACVACHAEPAVHKGRFGTGCAQCHSTSAWTGAAFDHDLAAFKLTGRHKTVDCKSCHVNNVYAGTAQTCASCHAEPAKHKGRYGTACAQCHTTSQWTGATFKHTFPLNHGRRGVSACTTCHTTPNEFKTYTCYGCHEHTPAKIERRHAKRIIANLQDCVRCHANGREHGQKERDTDNRLPGEGPLLCMLDPFCERGLAPEEFEPIQGRIAALLDTSRRPTLLNRLVDTGEPPYGTGFRVGGTERIEWDIIGLARLQLKR